jgi:hypothetical protein
LALEPVASVLGHHVWERIAVYDTRGAIRLPQRRRLGGRHLIVEWFVEKGTSSGLANYPILTKSNYNQWSLLMKIKLEARGLWAAVDPGNAEFQLDRMALDAICSALPPEMIVVLATKDTVKEAWESIKTMWIRDDRIRKASAQRLRREYEMLAFRDGEGIEDFTMRLAGIVNQLATLGDPEPDDKVVLKYLRIARPRYKQLVLSIETLLNVSTLSIEEVTGRLKAAEDDAVESSIAEGKLLLSEEEWVERSKKKETGDGSRGGSRAVAAGEVVAVMVEIVAKAEGMAAVVMVSAHRAGTATTCVIAAISWDIGPETVGASSP